MYFRPQYLRLRSANGVLRISNCFQQILQYLDAHLMMDHTFTSLSMSVLGYDSLYKMEAQSFHSKDFTALGRDKT